ncbi:hypothetical protein Tco_0695699 [Tanacetum coccineum]
MNHGSEFRFSLDLPDWILGSEQDKAAAANAALTLMMLRGDSRELGSGQSSRDVGKNKSRKSFKCAVCFKEFGEFGSGTALGGHMGVHKNVVTKQQGHTLDLLQEIQAGRSFSGSYESPSDTKGLRIILGHGSALSSGMEQYQFR